MLAETLGPSAFIVASETAFTTTFPIALTLACPATIAVPYLDISTIALPIVLAVYLASASTLPPSLASATASAIASAIAFSTVTKDSVLALPVA